jgi:hypothetical protein
MALEPAKTLARAQKGTRTGAPWETIRAAPEGCQGGLENDANDQSNIARSR